MSGGGKGGGLGGSGMPGFLSSFDRNAVNQAQQAATSEVTNRYGQLGLGQTQAVTAGPTTGATPGVPGSGTTPTTLYGGGANTPGNIGAGPTAMQMDLGTAPSTTGGIPEEAQALLGEIQTQDLSETASQQSGANQGKGGIGALSSLAGGGGGK